jgi:hypothetical protein
MYVPDIVHKKAWNFIPCLSSGLPRPHNQQVIPRRIKYDIRWLTLIVSLSYNKENVVVNGTQG